MMKMILLAGTMALSGAAFAQTTTTVDPAAQATTPTAPVAPTTATQADPAASAPAADTAAAQPAADTAQVASAVDTQFGQYDKNADGKLDRAEFSTWMVALKTASDPSTKADSAATKKWIGAAFAQADTDKSRSVDKTEATGFLSQGQS